MTDQLCKCWNREKKMSHQPETLRTEKDKRNINTQTIQCTKTGEGIVALYAMPNPFLWNKICLDQCTKTWILKKNHKWHFVVSNYPVFRHLHCIHHQPFSWYLNSKYNTEENIFFVWSRKYFNVLCKHFKCLFLKRKLMLITGEFYFAKHIISTIVKWIFMYFILWMYT